MRLSIGVSTFTALVYEVWESCGLPPYPKPVVECFFVAAEDTIKIRVGSPHFKTAADYVDEAWERNRLTY